MTTVEGTTGAVSISRRRRWLFRALVALVGLICLEVFARYGLGVLNRTYPMDPMAEITPERVEAYLAERYHPQLGWVPLPSQVNSLGARNPHEYEDLTQTISAYGDSYTYCDGVPAEDAWPMQLEKLAGCGVLNFGVQGYGTDQALLRLESLYDRVPSRTVLLCIQPENINRCVNIYRGFYVRGMEAPKPRFILKDGGVDVYNPFSTPEAVRRMFLEHPEELLAAAAKHDYWYRQQLFLGKPWRIAFPYTLHLAARVPFIFDRLSIAATDISSHVPLFAPGSDSFAVMQGIIRRFRAMGQERGFHALIVILPPPRDVYRLIDKGELTYQSLHDFLKAEDIPFVDLIHTFAEHPDPKALMVQRRDHISREGGAAVAAKVLEFLREQDALPDDCTPPPQP